MATTERKTAIFVDGFNLYYGRLSKTAYKWLDLVALFDHILNVQDPTSRVTVVKYFTAPVLARFASHGNASVAAQDTYHRALKARHPDRFEITFGKHTLAPAWAPTWEDGAPVSKTNRTRIWKLEEKLTDVNLAMAMYRDAAAGRYEQMVLCSNDSDAEPVMRAIREDFPSIALGLVSPVCPPTEKRFRSVSTSLAQHAAWTRHYLLDEELLAAQLPPTVSTKKKAATKPTHWIL